MPVFSLSIIGITGPGRGFAPTKLAPHVMEEAAEVALPASGALSALIALGHVENLDLTPVMPSNEAAPVS